MHVEHEILERPYVNDETMLGDQVSDIPRSNFWASEDGYAWDMEELAAALSANGGVMRNPLSRELFSPEDVRSIVQHPLGGHLGALQVQQAELVKGLRQSTIERLSQLSKLLLEDQSLDSIPSRRGIDEFLNYLASLPASEQKAVDMLRVPARDSHTGQAYDWSIGDALRDGQANKVCLHKTGDFIGQAATHLKLQR
ncbi:hypothetical protein M501DRAFT_1006362 [Patellaria atrata CBS 101060]|uniref:Uncharacterized protein n=1 Tax=Patellaria atrata CBS 101060 TaxID=1346257 RepID=A0A9P4S825_9PEZI|nr:hypothetical protein M501DRAFT_1006362 [Patellaria atrata CBS 101060]